MGQETEHKTGHEKEEVDGSQIMEANDYKLIRALNDISENHDKVTYVGHAGWPDGRRQYIIEYYEKADKS